MPKNRGRKKKKKNTAKNRRSNKPVKDREVFKKDGLEIIREGKNVIFRNNRTTEQHEAFIEEVKKNRPNQLKEIESRVERAIKIFEEYDNLKLLGGLAYNQIAAQFNPSDDGLSEITLELGLSFSVAIDGNSAKEPAPKIINELIDCLIDIRHGYNGYVMTENVTGKYSEIESKLRFKTIMEALYIRGDGYTQHIYSIYKELFSGHDEFLFDKYGFKSSDILNTILQLEDSFCCRLILPNGLPHPANHSRFVQWSETKTEDEIVNYGKHFIDFYGDENPDLIIQDTKIHGYGIDQIETYPDLFKIRFRTETHKKVASAISQKFGDNSEFLNPKFKGLPLNDSLTFTKPVIEYDDNYYLFAFALPTRNLFEITEKLIKDADQDYYIEKYLGNKYSKSRDNYLELKTAELFKKIIPNSDSHLNLKYKPGDTDESGNLIETELDLLIVSERANYLIEMKAGGLSAPSRRGALKSLSGQLKETVGYGAYQSYRALKYIISSETPTFYDKANEITLDKTKKTFRITVTMEHLADLIAYMYDLKELGVIESDVDFAWTCSVFDLLIFSELIDSEKDFIDYLEKRIPLYQRPELNFHDEIDILGYFFEHDLEFDEELIKGLMSFQLNKYSAEIDSYFEKGSIKPKRKTVANTLYK